MKKVKKKCDITIVSIFVNPIQFNNQKDLHNYPKDLESDKNILIKKNVDILFAPSNKEIYPNDFPNIKILYPKLMNKLCGAKRKGHFEGVLFIIYKLLTWIRPAIAFFGLKDYQQCLLVSNMIKELELDTQISTVETARENSGLAYSSRNALLSEIDKKFAEQISKRLFFIKNLWEKNKNILVKQIQKELYKPMDKIKIEYFDVYDSETLTELSSNNQIKKSAVVAFAGTIKKVRLIDNIVLSDKNK